jgi:hypothetical protein
LGGGGGVGGVREGHTATCSRTASGLAGGARAGAGPSAKRGARSRRAGLELRDGGGLEARDMLAGAVGSEQGQAQQQQPREHPHHHERPGIEAQRRTRGDGLGRQEADAMSREQWQTSRWGLLCQIRSGWAAVGSADAAGGAQEGQRDAHEGGEVRDADRGTAGSLTSPAAQRRGGEGGAWGAGTVSAFVRRRLGRGTATRGRPDSK